MAAMLAHAALALSLAVRVYDARGVPEETLAAARATAARLLSAARIDVRWARCPCPNEVAADELLVRIAAAPPSIEPASLGYSYVDLAAHGGTLATVFVDRIDTLAQVAGVAAGELLGRAMAHEIAHLLLGTRDHETTGLMRGKWTTAELAADRPLDWLFSRRDAARLHAALARRRRAATPPAMAVARRELEDATLTAP